jgi:hypothetical protein
MRAGLSAAEAVSRLWAPDGGALAALAGVASGEAVVGEVLGEGEARERIAKRRSQMQERADYCAMPTAVMSSRCSRGAHDRAPCGSRRGHRGQLRYP